MSLIVKICGLSTPEALDVALDAGADMVGFVFFPPSPRHLAFDAARMLGDRVRGRAQKLALTVDADDATFEAIVGSLRPGLLQLHGKETPARLAALKRRFGLPVMKAIPVEGKSDLTLIADYVAIADRLLFDARAPRAATRAGRAREIVRLAASGKSRSWHAVHAVGRARRCQCRRGVAHHRRGRGRCLLRRRARAGRQRP